MSFALHPSFGWNYTHYNMRINGYIWLTKDTCGAKDLITRLLQLMHLNLNWTWTCLQLLLLDSQPLASAAVALPRFDVLAYSCMQRPKGQSSNLLGTACEGGFTVPVCWRTHTGKAAENERERDADKKREAARQRARCSAEALSM